MTPEYERVREAYLAMAKVGYRPAAKSDGFGNIQLSAEQLESPELLAAEASLYAHRFLKEENELSFFIGVSDWASNRALVYTVEAARLMCCGSAEPLALKMLALATDELRGYLGSEQGRRTERNRRVMRGG